MRGYAYSAQSGDVRYSLPAGGWWGVVYARGADPGGARLPSHVLLRGGRVIGVLVVQNRTERVYSDDEVEDDVFGVNLIPHTWDVTTLGTLKVGYRVNLEIDMLARYLARWRETA